MRDQTRAEGPPLSSLSPHLPAGHGRWPALPAPTSAGWLYLLKGWRPPSYEHLQGLLVCDGRTVSPLIDSQCRPQPQMPRAPPDALTSPTVFRCPQTYGHGRGTPPPPPQLPPRRLNSGAQSGFFCGVERIYNYWAFRGSSVFVSVVSHQRLTPSICLCLARSEITVISLAASFPLCTCSAAIRGIQSSSATSLMAPCLKYKCKWK